ncbi:MAG: phosphotransferase [Acidimicrobiia bacterium]|nr:phosphotransferase [Acidimicrobiia bacterium]
MGDEATDVRRGDELDLARVGDFVRRALPELDGALELLQFPGGSANLTYLLRVGPTELVLRRPPFGTLAPGAHDMRREYKVLSRLWEHFDRAPRAFAFCDDPEVAGADFFLMERRRGEVVRDELPDSLRRQPDIGRRLGLALVDAFADLALLSPEACGLADLGKPAGFIERQVSGWANRWSRVKEDNPLPIMDDVAARLADTIPTSTVVALVHNDPKMDNCQFDPAGPDRVTAIFDWDMTTVGDPLADLGTLLNYWPDPSDPPGAWRGSNEGLRAFGLPTRREVVERYRARTGFDCSRAGWYEAFAQWKTAVVVAQLHHRWLQGDSANPRHETIAEAVPVLAASADQLLDVELASG